MIIKLYFVLFDQTLLRPTLIASLRVPTISPNHELAQKPIPFSFPTA